jgi:integral membrane protein
VTPDASAAREGSPAFQTLRVVAVLEGVSFALLLISSLLKRTTDTDLVPVLGPIHGALFVAVVLLVLSQLARLRWSPFFTLVMLTVGSPGVHFALQAWVRSLSEPGTRSA